uniref:Acid sensing ion channel subunit 1 n=1 Tax=Zonotrichia albicollis TaxID=44394 RepID=A0A8D2NIL4_ZONAL
ELFPDEEDEEDAGATTDFVAFASSCTLHGLSHIFVEGSLGARQALWALAFLLSLSVFLYQVADRIAYYLEYHHVTLLSEEESPEMTFPAVTFCNINRVRLSQLSHEDLLYLAPLVDYEPGMELGFTPAQPGPWEEDEPLNLYGFFNRTCHQLEDMLLSCSYRGQRCGPGDFAVSPGLCLLRRCLAPLPVSSPAGLHPLWEVLHLQCGAGREASAHHHEGGHWKRPGNHAGHPAGRVPASVGGNR